MRSEENGKSIILYDGVCNFCNASVNFIIRHDKKNRFLFAALQSSKAKELLTPFNLNNESINTFVLIENKIVYLKSNAALRIIKRLDKLYPLLFGFIIIPSFIRNGVYSYIARNRYKWFGKQTECIIPSDEIKGKFIS